VTGCQLLITLRDLGTTPDFDGTGMFWDSQYSPSQLGTLLGVAGGLGSLSNTGQYCLGEGWFADVHGIQPCDGASLQAH